MMDLRTCIVPPGQFVFGIHKPSFSVTNLREKDWISALGAVDSGETIENHDNFPLDTVEEKRATQIFEINNPFPFRGTTYINRHWADQKAKAPTTIKLPAPPDISFSQTMKQWIKAGAVSSEKADIIFSTLPETMLLSLASTSTDPNDLIRLADFACDLIRHPETNFPIGLRFQQTEEARFKPVIKNEKLFEILTNNPYLPVPYKHAMVLKPGIQGSSEIVGECIQKDNNSHIFEYLRRNSYIPWGHYAANMADDAIRYHMKDLSLVDMKGLRHLYYQRTFVRLADQFGMDAPQSRKMIAVDDLEILRQKIMERLVLEVRAHRSMFFNKTLWGWNYGFDYAPTNYRLHASHQQIHQQFALIPAKITPASDNQLPDESSDINTFACGDLITDTIKAYKAETGHSFFDHYITAIRTNRRMDQNPKAEQSLIVYEDEHVILFVPKAQTSQWELQLMTLSPIGNILEADQAVRNALDRGLWTAMQALTAIGAQMITTIEYAKRIDALDSDQRLMYVFLPKLPESPGGFSEAQMRWIIGHYPEDFAASCRSAL